MLCTLWSLLFPSDMWVQLSLLLVCSLLLHSGCGDVDSSLCDLSWGCHSPVWSCWKYCNEHLALRRNVCVSLGTPGVGWQHQMHSLRPALQAHHTHVCPCLVAEPVASPPSQNNGTTSPDPFESQPLTMASSKPSSARKTPESFLGPNAALVNLDSLVTRPAPSTQSLNPFLAPGTLAPSVSSAVCFL